MSTPSLSEDLVRDTLKTVKYPGFSRDIVSFGLVKNVAVDGADVKVVGSDLDKLALKDISGGFETRVAARPPRRTRSARRTRNRQSRGCLTRRAVGREVVAAPLMTMASSSRGESSAKAAGPGASGGSCAPLQSAH